jgi:hypothetical protein
MAPTLWCPIWWSSWLVHDARLAYATNTASDTITGYLEAPDGQLELLHADGVSATTDAGPIDIAAAPDGRQVFELNGLAGDLGVYAVAPDGAPHPHCHGAWTARLRRIERHGGHRRHLSVGPQVTHRARRDPGR